MKEDTSLFIYSYESLLVRHRRHDGVYARVAERIGVDPSYVSKVASGERQSEQVKIALLAELASIEKQNKTRRRVIRAPGFENLVQS